MKINNILILFIAFDYILSLNEPKNLEFDVETSFDEKYNNEFLFYYNNDIFPLIMKSDSKKNKKYDIYYDAPGYSGLTDYTGIFYHAMAPAIGIYHIKIEAGEGTIWIHPMNNTINIDFTQKCYGIKEFINFFKFKGSMKYLVSNLKENKTAYFSYDYEYNNPFKVCHGNECVSNLNKYKFIKGEEYTIEVKMQEFCIEADCRYILNSYSICCSINLKINLFILLFLLSMIFYH